MQVRWVLGTHCSPDVQMSAERPQRLIRVKGTLHGSCRGEGEGGDELPNKHSGNLAPK
jgi:hypothetical protein